MYHYDVIVLVTSSRQAVAMLSYMYMIVDSRCVASAMFRNASNAHTFWTCAYLTIMYIFVIVTVISDALYC